MQQAQNSVTTGERCFTGCPGPTNFNPAIWTNQMLAKVQKRAGYEGLRYLGRVIGVFQ
jgi:hypothetical protein